MGEGRAGSCCTVLFLIERSIVGSSALFFSSSRLQLDDLLSCPYPFPPALFPFLFCFFSTVYCRVGPEEIFPRKK